MSILRSLLLCALPLALFGAAGCTIQPCEDGAMGYGAPVTQARGATLTVAVGTSSAAGTVTSLPAGIACTPDCSETYAVGQRVTLTATAQPGWRFEEWRGDCSGESSTASVVMDYDKVCDAIFRPIAPPSEDAGASAPDESGDNQLGGLCCAPAGSEISYALCPEGGAKCCLSITAVECAGSGGVFMSTASCQAAGPTC